MGARAAAYGRERLRRGHIQHVDRGSLAFTDGTVAMAEDALVVHCAADGLKYPALLPVWDPEAIALQPIRAGLPCLGAAVTGYVDATRDSDAEKSRLCPPSPFPDTMATWARMNVLGTQAAMSFSAETDIKAWSGGVALNPARVAPGHPVSATLDDARERLAKHTKPGLARLAELAGTI